jgi:hypothetical protein
LISVHMLLAMRLSAPEMNLSVEEAERLDKAIKRVARHYPVQVTQKQLDIGLLIYAGVEIYGTRIAAMVVNRKAAKARGSAPDNVAPFPGVMSA